MKRSGRLWRLLAVLLGMLLVLSSCGEDQSFDTEKLSVWIWSDGQQESWETLIQSWSEKTRITVELEVKDRASYWQELGEGNLPDLFWVDTGHAQSWSEAGRLHQLDEFLEADKSVRLEDFQEELLPPFQSGGKTYALPHSSSVTALWYNKDLFDQKSLAYPDETWTWEDLYTVAQQLTNRHNGLYGLTLGVEDTADGWYNLIYAYGGAVVRLEEEGGRVSGWGEEATGQAMDVMARLIRDCMPSQTIQEQLGTASLFANGHVAMTLLSSQDALDWGDTFSGDQWGCTLLPYCDRDGSGTCEPEERVSLVTGTGWAISAKSQDGAAAYDLLTVLAGEEGRSIQTNQISVPDAGLDEEWVETLDAKLQPYGQMLAQGTLTAAPVARAEESWDDYAQEETMYTAWNNPDQMAAQLAKQDQYTSADLTETNAAQEAAQTEES